MKEIKSKPLKSLHDGQIRTPSHEGFRLSIEAGLNSSKYDIQNKLRVMLTDRAHGLKSL